MERNGHHHHHHLKSPSRKLEKIKEDEEGGVGWLPKPLRPPETPTESMEFLARSWSLTAVELSKALTEVVALTNPVTTDDCSAAQCIGTPPALLSTGKSHPTEPLPRGTPRGKTMGGWLKDQKEKKRAEARSHTAQVHAAATVAGVAAAVAAITAGSVFSQETTSCGSSKLSGALASAAALVASHCVEMAQMMGASRDQILTLIRSAVNAQTAGDIMTLTAGAATALRGAATLRARHHKEIQGAALVAGESKLESNGCLSALAFVSNGGELLKLTRKGILHWKQVSVYINSNCQVIVKMESTHMAGTYVKKKKGVIKNVCRDIAEWPGREVGDGRSRRAYFGIRTPERLIEFECRNKGEKQIWVEGIQQMLDRYANK